MLIKPVLCNFQIEQLTSSTVPRYIVSILSTNPEKMSNFTFTNNIVGSDQVIEVGNAGGGPENCAMHAERLGPAGGLKNCFDNSTFTNNVIGGGSGWPPGNILVKDEAAAGVRLEPKNGAPKFSLCKGKEDGCSKRSPVIGARTHAKNICS